MRQRVLASLLAGALLVVLPTAGSQAVAEPVPFSSSDVGINVGHYNDGVDVGIERRLDGIDALFGDEVSPIVRIQLNWHAIQPSRGGPIDWSRIDEQVAQAEQRGMRVLLLLAYAPTWANGSSNIVWFPTNDADWKAIVDATVAHFGERIQAYEVWNEPNMIGVFGGYDLAPPVQRYWELVRIAHESVHARCATCTVVAGASALGNNHPDSGRPTEWLRYAYDHGYGPYFDALALHPYSSWDGPAAADCTGLGYQGFGPIGANPPCGELGRVRALMVDRGDAAKKIWTTEIGYPVKHDADQANQARWNLTLSLRMWRMLSYTGPFIVFSYRDECADDSEPGCFFGMVDRNDAPKGLLYTDMATALRFTSKRDTNERLLEGESLRSVDGRYTLALTDGNLVLSRYGTTIWSTGTTTGARLTNQDDGNLVLREEDGHVLWSSGTYTAGPSQMVLQNDGNLVLIRNRDMAVTWSSGTATMRSQQVLSSGDAGIYSTDRSHRLVFGSDGNLVLSRGTTPLWSTGTNTGYRLTLQDDGNLVMRQRASNAVVWQTGTYDHGPAYLRVHGDGNVILRRTSDDRVIWQTGPRS